MNRAATCVWMTALSLAACATAGSNTGAPAPGFSFPVRIAEGSPQAVPSAMGSTRREDGPPPPEERPTLPDPPALMMAEQWEYEFLYDQGTVSVARVRPRLFEHPVASARRMGRFAVELWIGHELIERVRFDFPGLAAEPPPTGTRHPLHEPPSLAEHAVVSRSILVPASPRATSAVLVDRATGTRTHLPWPPDHPLPPIDPPDDEPDGGHD